MMNSSPRFNFLLVILSVAVVTDAVIFSRCDLASTLYRKYDFPRNQIADWVCLIEAESGRNTAAVGATNSNGSKDYGLYQINSLYWCSGGVGSKYNECNVKCSSLTNDDISDDVKCVRLIFSRHNFAAWYGWQNKCKGRDVSSYISGCNI